MTHEEKKAIKGRIKEAAFHDAMEASAANVAALGACPGDAKPESWEGMMNMLADVFRRGDPEDKAAAVLAAPAWVWGRKEADLKCRVKAVLEGPDAESEPEPEPAEAAGK